MEVHLQTAEKAQRRGEWSTSDIPPHWLLWSLMQGTKYKQDDIHLCPALMKDMVAVQGGLNYRRGSEVFLLTSVQSDWLLTRLAWWTAASLHVCQQTLAQLQHNGGGVWSKLTGLQERVAVICRDGKLQTNVERSPTKLKLYNIWFTDGNWKLTRGQWHVPGL